MTAAPENKGCRCSRRRLLGRLTLGGIGLFLVAWVPFLGRLLAPRSAPGGPRLLRAGRPGAYGLGAVDTRFLKSHRIWIVRDHQGLYALFARCTHLGCTPVWVGSVRKFKCPCHGSGFALDGTNLEGPAPIPLERFAVSLDARGELVVDLGARLQRDREGRWSGPGSLLPLDPGEA